MLQISLTSLSLAATKKGLKVSESPRNEEKKKKTPLILKQWKSIGFRMKRNKPAEKR